MNNIECVRTQYLVPASAPLGRRPSAPDSRLRYNKLWIYVRTFYFQAMASIANRSEQANEQTNEPTSKTAFVGD